MSVSPMQYRRFAPFFIALLVSMFVFPGAVDAQISDINDAINKAGRERMLSQRIAKSYLQIGQGIDPERSRRVLDASMALFDRQLVELKNYAPTPEIRHTYMELERVWIAYKDLLVGVAPNLRSAPEVLERSDQVLALAHLGTVQLESLSATTSGYLVNIAGRQRMLSQRMARNYQAMAWGLVDTGLGAELDVLRAEFSAALDELSVYRGNSSRINDRLALVRQQWIFFEDALNQRDPGNESLALNVATTSERILEVMEEVVAMYEAVD